MSFLIDKNIEKIRNEYNILNYVVYLASAGTGPAGNYWLKAVNDYFDFVKRGAMWAILGVHTDREGIAKEGSAEIINAKKKEVTNMYRIMTNTNFIVFNVLKWEKGDNVVFTDLCYPSIPIVLKHLARKKGVELRRVENVGGEILMSDLEKNVDDNTKLVFINRTTPFCGFTYNVKEVCKIAHDRNALVVDDAIQALGAIDIDVHSDNVDFLISGSYKWQCGPEGAGIFYIREDLIDKFDPLFRNYLTAEYPGMCPVLGLQGHDNLKSWDYPIPEDAKKFNLGECTGEELFGWKATLKFLNDLGTKNIEEKTRGLGGYLIEKLQDIGCKVLTPVEPEKRHGLIVYTTGSRKNDEKSIGAFSGAKPKPILVSMVGLGGIEGIRVATHFFNTEEDIDSLIREQKRIL